MKKIFTLCFLLAIVCVKGWGQTITMTNSAQSTCSATYYDPGGTANYANNANFTQTISPGTAGNAVKIVFSSFSTESGFDFLSIYNGSSANAGSLIGKYSGTTSPGTITSTAADGSLTFVFTSDGNTVSSGWVSSLSCIALGTSISMTSGTTLSTCSSNYYDPQGTGNYRNSTDITQTVTPGADGKRMQIVFSSFNTEANFDYLYIYNGNSTSAPLIGQYSGTQLQGQTISSTANDGSLTFRFTSDGGTVSSGWVGALSCVDVPYRDLFISMNTGSSTWCAGETRNVSVTIKNTGTATWTDASPDINIGVKWNTNGTSWTDYHIRTNANNLTPGATSTYTLPITAANNVNGSYTTPLAAGSNNLTFDVVYEGLSWFGDNSGVGPGNTKFVSAAQTITAPPSITTPPSNKSVCEGAGTSFTVAATGTSLSYQWQLSTDNGGTWNNLSNAGVYTGTATATLTISNTTGLNNYRYRAIVTGAGSCSAISGAALLTVNALPTASISYAGSPYCSNGGTASVSQTGTTGGTYTAAAALSISSTTGAINLAASTPGTYTVTYSFTNGTCPNTTTASVTITALPVATFSYTGSPYCQSTTNPSPTYSGGGAAGVFSSTTGLAFASTTTGQINLSASTPGTYTVTNTRAAANGCTQVTATSSITITATPSATISYNGSPYCKSIVSAPVTRTGTVGGTYTSTTGLSINASTGEINPSLSTAGNYTVTYTVAAAGGCSEYTTTAPVTVTAIPVATFSYTGTSYCQNATNPSPTYSGGGSAGTFSSTAGLVFVSTSTGQVNLNASTPGTYTVTNTKVAAGGCSQVAATSPITILALPTASISYANSPYCLNAGTATVTLSGTTGGAYSASPAGLSINSSTGAITLANSAAGTYTVTYTFTSSTTGCTNSTTAQVTVNPIPVGVTASATPNPVCSGSAVALTSLPSATSILLTQNFNNGFESWITNNYSIGGTTSAAAWTVRNNGYTYGVTFHSNDNSRFALTNSDAQGSNQFFTLTQLVSPSFSTVGLSSCSLNFYQYLPNDFFDIEAEVDISVDGGSSWSTIHDYIDDGTIGSSGAFANTNLDLSSYVGYNSVKIRFEFQSLYGLWWAIDNINVTGGGIGSPFTYAWTSAPAGFTASTQNATATPTVNTTYNIKVTNSYNCSVSASTPVTINPKPTATLNNSSSQTICSGSSANLSISFTGTAPWSVTYSNGSTSATVNNINSNPFLLSVSPTSTTTYTLTSLSTSDANCSGGTASGSATVTVNPVSVGGTVNGSTAVCVSSNSGTLNLTGQTGSVVQWEKSTDNGANWTPVTNTTASLSYSSLTQTTQYRVLVKSGVCSSMYSSVATITVNPASVGGTVNSSNSVCSGSSGSLTLTGQTGAITRWESSTNGGSTWTNIANTGTSQSYSNITQTTQYRVLIQSGNCSSTYSSVAVITVNPVTVGGTVNSSNSICSGSSGSLTLTGYTGSIVQWEQSTDNGNSWTVLSNTTATQAYTSLTQTTQYKALVKSGACSSMYSGTAILTIKPLPVASLLFTPGNGAACAGSPVGITFSGTAGSTINYGINPGNPSINVAANSGGSSSSNAGDYTYTINSVMLSGCEGTVSNGTQTVHIVANPDATISGFDYVQIGNQINLTGGTGGGAWSSNNTGAAAVGGSSGVVTGASSGTATITYQVNNTANGITCSSSSTKPITITADYVTRNNGNFSDFNTWKRGTVNGFVNAGTNQIPTLANTIEVQHDLTLDQDFQLGSNKSFVMSAAGTMLIQPGKTFSSSGSVNFGHKAVTVQSNASGTGAIGQMASNIINADNVTIERYTQAGSSNSGHRAWRLVTSPVTNRTIHEAWQEGHTWISGGSNNVTETGTYGTLITGEGLTAAQAQDSGFDYVGAGNHTSIRSYQYNIANTGGNWQPFASNNGTGTNISIHYQPAYMLFVRGDRLANNATAKSPSTLRATGILNQAAATITVPGSRPYTLVGNPFAAALNFENIYNSSINSRFEIWNSSQGDYGAYNTVIRNGANDYSVIPFGTQTSTPANGAQFIESGSGFFVSPASASDGSITINESAKNPQAENGVGTFREVPVADRKLWVNLNLKDNDTAVRVTDGVLVRFSDLYADGIDNDDAVKQNNFNENMSTYSSGKYLTLEARAEVKTKDTVTLRLWSLAKRAYQFQIKADNFNVAGMKAYLEDNYLGTKQELNLDGGITSVDFSVTADTNSSKLDRFHIVFQNNAVVLPVTLTSVKAVAQNGGVTVSWNVTNEVNIKGYTIEKSSDGRNFAALGSQQPARNNSNSAITSYNGFDAKPVLGDNFYRIRIEAKNGAISYSEIVKANIGGSTGIQIAIYPNPVRDGKVNLALTNLATGNYLASIYSNGGQVVYQRKIAIGQSNAMQNEELKIGKGLAQGDYQLRITNEKGKEIKNIKLMVGR